MQRVDMEIVGRRVYISSRVAFTFALCFTECAVFAGCRAHGGRPGTENEGEMSTEATVRFWLDFLKQQGDISYSTIEVVAAAAASTLRIPDFVDHRPSGLMDLVRARSLESLPATTSRNKTWVFQNINFSRQ